MTTAAILLHPVAGFASDEDPFTTYRSHPPDSVEARHAAILSGPEWFQDIFDSLIVAADLKDPDQAVLFETAGRDYLAATGDSLLLSDYEFVSSIPEGTRPDWYTTVVTDVRGWILRDEGDLQGSAVAFREAAEAYRRLGHLRREAVAWGSLGVSYFRLADWDASEGAYVNALEARRRLGDPLLIGRTLNAMGSVNLRKTNYHVALDYYGQARAVRETLDRPGDLGTTLGYIGNVHYRLGNLEEARRSYLSALEVFGPAGEEMIHPARSGLANIHAELGEHRRAIELYREQLTLAEAQDDQREAAVMHVSLAIELRAIGDHAGALRELGRAREIQQSTEDFFHLSRTMNWLGIVYGNLGNFSSAMDAFKEAERLAIETENKMVLGRIKANFGVVYQQMGLFERAIETYEEALVVQEELEDRLGTRDVYS